MARRTFALLDDLLDRLAAPAAFPAG
jgi:hypothetical protein